MKLTLEWMEWTVPTAIFCGTIILSVIAMAVWQTVSPSLERRGFLPIPTTPGDRLFIGILTSVYIFFAWIGLTHFALWILLIVVVCWIIVVMIWGQLSHFGFWIADYSAWFPCSNEGTKKDTKEQKRLKGWSN